MGCIMAAALLFVGFIASDETGRAVRDADLM
jgi:hypothetical protein